MKEYVNSIETIMSPSTPLEKAISIVLDSPHSSMTEDNLFAFTQRKDYTPKVAMDLAKGLSYNPDHVSILINEKMNGKQLSLLIRETKAHPKIIFEVVGINVFSPDMCLGFLSQMKCPREATQEFLSRMDLSLAVKISALKIVGWPEDLTMQVALDPLWKEMSFIEQMDYVRLSKYNSIIVTNAVACEDCSWEDALSLAEETKYDSLVLEKIVQRDDCTWHNAIDFAVRVMSMYESEDFVQIIARRFNCLVIAITDEIAYIKSRYITEFEIQREEHLVVEAFSPIGKGIKIGYLDQDSDILADRDSHPVIEAFPSFNN